MKLRAKLIFSAIALLSFLLLAWQLGEPRFQGRTLTSWLRECSETPLMEKDKLTRAQDAVQTIGTEKALPRLLQLVKAKNDTASTWIISTSEELKLDFLKWHSAEDFQQWGVAGFEALGTNAMPALGELTTLLDNKDHAFIAARCLTFLGHPAEPSMCKALTNANPQVRRFAVSQLYWVSDDVRVYVGHLTNNLNDPDATVRYMAIESIGAQTEMPETVIPILLSVLAKNDGNVSTEAVGLLARFGTNAAGAFPALTNIVMNEPFDITAGRTLETMAAIAPDRAMPIVLTNWHSADLRRRRTAIHVLAKYPIPNAEILSVFRQAVNDPEPTISRFAQSFLTGKYQQQHPDESVFSDEPSYGGKKLGEWLQMRDADSEFPKEARDAIRHMGTNAIPSLLNRLTFVRRPFGARAYNINVDAMRAFIALGEAAKPAFPQLTKLMDGTNQDFALYAMMATCGTGSNAIPVLVKGLTNQFEQVRNEATNDLKSLDPIAAAKMGIK